MNRTLLGICSLALLVLGGGTWLAGSEGITSTGFAAGCLRVGAVLGALWLALPQIERFLKKTPRWLLVASLIAIVLVAIRPRLLIVALPILAVLWTSGLIQLLLQRPAGGGSGTESRVSGPVAGRRRFKRRPPT